MSTKVNLSCEEPLLGLCPRPLHLMSPEELRAVVTEIQENRSPQTWRSRVVKQTREEKERVEQEKKVNIEELI